MAQTYFTLDEAAEKLGMAPADFRRRLRTEWSRTLKPLQDGSTQRFRSKDIEELARQIGIGSSDEFGDDELLQVDPSSDERRVPAALSGDAGKKKKSSVKIPKPPVEESDELELPFELLEDVAPRSAKKSSLKMPKPAMTDQTTSAELEVPDELLLIDDEDDPKPVKKSSMKMPKPAAPKKKSDDDILLTDSLDLGDQDIFLLADDEPKRPSAKSSIKLKKPATKADSSVRLPPSGIIKRGAPDDSGTEEIELDILPKSGSSNNLGGLSGKMTSASSARLSSPKSSKMPKPSLEDDSSEFELTLDADSSDEFELSLEKDDSDEISLGDLPMPKSGKAGASGINIGKPKDSGLSLERQSGLSSILKKSGKIPMSKTPASEEDEIDFELTLDQPGASSKKLGSSKRIEADDSSSEFDLSLDDSSAELEVDLDAETGSADNLEVEEDNNDIFETDFEIPALDDDSASEAVAIDEGDTDLESSSDFDLAIDGDGEEDSVISVDDDEESGSQVVVIDDEIDEPSSRKKKKKPGKKKRAVEDEEGEEEVSFSDMDIDAEGEPDEEMDASTALAGAEDEEEEEEVEQAVVERFVEVRPAPWGIVPVTFLFPTVFIMFIGGIMGYELINSMWGYHQTTTPSSLVVDGVAEMIDMKSPETEKN